MARYCQRCGTDLPKGAGFCNRCGAQVQGQKSSSGTSPILIVAIGLMVVGLIGVCILVIPNVISNPNNDNISPVPAPVSETNTLEPEAENTNEVSHEDKPDELAPVNEIGSRLNPAPARVPFSGNVEKHREEIDFTITVSEIIRGEDALNFAIQANQFNEAPDGTELLLCKIDFTLDSYNEDDSYLCSSIRFDFYNGDYSEVSTFVSVAGLDGLHANLFEGASTSGWLYAAVDPGDETPYLLYEDEVWFGLY